MRFLKYFYSFFFSFLMYVIAIAEYFRLVIKGSAF